MVVSSKLGDRIKERMEAAIKQVGAYGSILIGVTKQKGATKEVMLSQLERLKAMLRNRLAIE